MLVGGLLVGAFYENKQKKNGRECYESSLVIMVNLMYLMIKMLLNIYIE